MKNITWSCREDRATDPKRVRKRVVQYAEQYHQSKLQALKEEVEDIPCSGKTFHAENFKKRVLNLITNLEDND